MSRTLKETIAHALDSSIYSFEVECVEEEVREFLSAPSDEAIESAAKALAEDHGWEFNEVNPESKYYYRRRARVALVAGITQMLGEGK